MMSRWSTVASPPGISSMTRTAFFRLEGQQMVAQ
jgi:hypothetical protein